MKCIKEKCNYSQITEDVGFCNEFNVYVWNDKCCVDKRVQESKKELITREVILNMVLANQ